MECTVLSSLLASDRQAAICGMNPCGRDDGGTHRDDGGNHRDDGGSLREDGGPSGMTGGPQFSGCPFVFAHDSRHQGFMGKGMVVYLKSISQWFLYILRETHIDLFVL